MAWCMAARLPCSASSSSPVVDVLFHLVLLFWYQVFTWVSVKFSLAANSCLS